MASFRSLTLKEMLEIKVEEYEQFGFEQAAMLLNTLRAARIYDLGLL
jgi:hypothetical protein